MRILETMLIDDIGTGDILDILTCKQTATHHVSMSSPLRIVHSDVAKGRPYC